ncbi:hypothetical protein niasHT_032612 [Heterodera trifolii]|uniref:Copper transporter n=1 Tax=Heterodera trifolii TaxID=157864 RepID=A0ABD2IEN8_9BILA
MLASSLFLTSNNSNKDGSSAADAESSPHSLLSALFGWWPDDFVHRLVQMSAGGPATADGGYAGPTLHFGEREYVVREQLLLLATAEDRQNTSAYEVQRRRRHSYVNSSVTGDGEQQPKKSKRQIVREEVRDIFRRIFTRARMLQALLYLIQWSLFIFAFVLVPCSTFNFSLIVAALIGKTAGYLLFIHSPAMQSVERIAAPTPSSSAGAIQMVATSKMLGSF